MHVIGPRTLGFGGFFWHGAWDWGVERLFVCCVVELRRNGRRVSVTGLNRIHRHTSTRDTEFYGEQAQKPMCGSALVLARRGSVAGETVKSVRTHASPMSVRTYAG